MTAIARRTWANMSTECEAVLGGTIYANQQTRIRQYLNDSYRQICVAIHHYGLDEEDTQTLVQGQSILDVPSNAYAIYGVTEIDSSGNTLAILSNKNEMVRKGLWISSEGQPDKFARTGKGGLKLQLNRPVDQDRRYRIDYLRTPTAPDFDGGSFYPDTDEVWDATIMDMALVRLGARTQSQVIYGMHKELLGDFLGMQIQPFLQDEPPADLPNRIKIDGPRGGNQG